MLRRRSCHMYKELNLGSLSHMSFHLSLRMDIAMLNTNLHNYSHLSMVPFWDMLQHSLNHLTLTLMLDMSPHIHFHSYKAHCLGRMLNTSYCSHTLMQDIGQYTHHQANMEPSQDKKTRIYFHLNTYQKDNFAHMNYHSYKVHLEGRISNRFHYISKSIMDMQQHTIYR